MYPKSRQSKIPYIRDTAINNKANFIALTESHLDPSTMEAEIEIAGFTPYRSERTTRSHGGTILYVANELTCTELLKYSNNYCSMNIIKINTLNLIMGIIYRPPDCTTAAYTEITEKIDTTIRNLGDPKPDIIILGDFNFPRINWPSGNIITGGTTVENEQATRLATMCNNLYLTQVIKHPTRKKNILDLAFTNNANLVHHYHIEPTTISDHNLIIISLNYNEKRIKKNTPKENTQKAKLLTLNYNKADWDLVNQKFTEVNWDELLMDTGPIEKVKAFIDKVEEICQKHIPKKSDHNRKNPIPRDRRILFRKMAKIKSRVKTNLSNHTQRLRDLENIIQIEQQLLTSYDAERAKQEETAVTEIKKNPRAFYKFASKFSKKQSVIGPFLDKNGESTSAPEELAQILNEQYVSVFSNPDPEKTVYNPKEFFSRLDPDKPTLTDITFSTEDIEAAINKLSTDSAPGPDGLSPAILKNCKTALSQPIFTIWRDSLDKGIIPSALKEATITPIHKGDSKALPKNYRPISLTSHLTKIFERVIRSKLAKFLEDNNYMNPSQHGFRTGRSCLSQLLEHYDNIICTLEQGHNIDVVYLDFAKAFDKVDHGILCHKLRHLGIGGKIGSWIHNFLSGRTQRVKVNNAQSKPANVTSSVPQGTVLGPILFLILIMDIDTNVNSRVSSFADDTRISRPISEQEDNIALQQDLNNVYDWQTTNNMEFNSGKFELLRYGKNQLLKDATHYTSPQGAHITNKASVKDLGIIMSSTATFEEHINKTCIKSRQYCGWIQRTFKTREPYVMKTLWNSLIQPRLDYCSQLWAPYKLKDIQKLEALPKTFTKQIPKIAHLNYWQRLKALNMMSQQRRMERYRIIYMWKILEGKVPNFGIEEVESIRHGRLCKVPRLRTGTPSTIQAIKENSLAVRGAQLFNNIPKEIRSVTSCETTTFKNKLDKFLSNIPDEPRLPGYTQQCRGPTNSIMDMKNIKN